MNSRIFSGVLSVAALVLAALTLGCDGQGYVNPETVRLVISHDNTSSQLVDECNYVPVLLGGLVKAEYPVDGALVATISLTRSAVTVSFSGVDPSPAPFEVAPQDIRSDSSTLADDPPAGYTVELRSGCAPDDG
jgi:hypothetical protein